MVIVCKACGADVLPHRTCPKCGQYDGRQVHGGIEAVEKELKVEKKASKKAEAAAKAEAPAEEIAKAE